MYGYIYMIVNKVNGKTYIGKRKCSKEWNVDKYMGSGTHKKYGKENLEKFLIQYCNSKNELNGLEIFWITEYRKRREHNVKVNIRHY